jgi:hypothetical protein
MANYKKRSTASAGILAYYADSSDLHDSRPDQTNEKDQLFHIGLYAVRLRSSLGLVVGRPVPAALEGGLPGINTDRKDLAVVPLGKPPFLAIDVTTL